MKMTCYGDPAAEVLLVQMVDSHDLAFLEREAAAIRARCQLDFCLLAFETDSWNDELSPWPAPAVFGRQAFGGQAEQTLANVLAQLPPEHKACYIGGYSLAGLFALWAASRTDRFQGVAAASPSVWFPGFAEDLQVRGIQCGTVYLSLGDREPKTRNPVMATVGEQITRIHGWLLSQGTDCCLEWNPGNHFQDADLRTASAFAWVMNHGRR